MADESQDCGEFAIDHAKLIGSDALDSLLLEWGEALHQAAPPPPEPQLPFCGVFGAPQTGHLLLLFCRRLSQPAPVFFRALQLFERFMQVHVLEMYRYITTKVEQAKREQEWKSLLERIHSQAVLRMLSCVQISSKLALHYKIITTKGVKSLLREAKHSYSLESVVNSEVRILKALKFQVSSPTCLDTLETLLTLLMQRHAQLVRPLWPRLPSAAVRLLRTACVRRSAVYLRLYRRTTGRAGLVPAARRQYAAVLADDALLAGSVLAAAAFLVCRTSSDLLLPPLADITLIPADDLLQLAELLLRDLLPDLDTE